MPDLQRSWADGPFGILSTPEKPSDDNPHAAIYIATEMTLSHNVLIRGLNSIYRQGPFLPPPSSPSFLATDITYFLFFTQAWVKIVHHHHGAEETVFFPELEKFTGDGDAMKGNKEEHERFHAGLEKLDEYVRNVKAEDWRWERQKEIMDEFCGVLYGHLKGEVETLLALEKYDSVGLRGIWKKTEDKAKGDIKLPGMFDTILPMVLGCADKTYEGGRHAFPPFPFFVPYLIDWWFAGYHRGAWRFCPCDMYGRPRELLFGE
ncbi:hypothetical protein M011DRAFT_472079 [Sporormia fimetaria CBS 119925]|uniref:Hemerythrin-like domain-containing protein n=1 Tax=Sporormia fimetaria CBS 119925 TaxID=1340428 RepID=A0A6A6UXZ0_9PLEO|nr:hypothetical protein M011DRAFT_472079 [Sporormia fimetaria CBS 119925]